MVSPRKKVIRTKIQGEDPGIIFAPCSKPQEVFLNSDAYFTLYGGE